MSNGSGYRVTLTAWLACADDLDAMIAARERIGDLRQDAATAGFDQIEVATEFQKFRRHGERGTASSGPPEAASSQASAPPEATHEAPPQAGGAGDAAAEAT